MLRPSLVSSFIIAALFTSILFSGFAAESEPPVELTLFHTNDIHSHMSAPKADEFRLGGLSRLATLLSVLRKQRGPSITLDAGDWSEGSWAYSVDTGANMLRILDQLAFDAVVVGNHDYLSGPDRMVQTVKEAAPRFPVLASNLDFSLYGPEAGTEFRKAIVPTTILDRGGLKIGIIGLTTIDAAYAPFLQPVFVTSPIAEARARVAELRPLVDVLIVLSHNTFELNVALADTVPGIDAVVSGHSHKKVSRAVTVQSSGKAVPIVETGKWGTFLGDLRFVVNRAAKAVRFTGYELHPVLPSIAQDPAVEALVQLEYQKISRLFGDDIHKEVADCDVALDDVDSHHASLGDLTTKSYRDSTGSDLALELMALVGVKTASGPLTVEALHDVMPHILNFKTGKEWTIKVVEVWGLEVRMIMDLLYSTIGSGAVGADGVETTWEPKADSEGQSIVSVKIGGQALDLARRYKIAVTDGTYFALQGVNTRYSLGLDLSHTRDSGIEGWRAVLGYASKMKHLTATGLRSGGQSFPRDADPAVYDYGMRLENGAIQVEVANEGLAPAEAARLECSTGAVNDLAAYDTDDEVFTKLGEAPVPALESGAHAAVSVPWMPSVAGFWPVECRVISDADAYSGNSKGRRVFLVTEAAE